MTNLAYTAREIRTATILTASYVSTDVMWWWDNNKSQDYNQSVLFIDFTIGSLTSMELKIEYSNDGVIYFQDTFIDISGGTAIPSLWEYSFNASWRYNIASPFKAKFIKASVKWTGTVTWSSCSITWILGIA